MIGVNRTGVVVILSLALIAGCSHGSSSNTAGSANGGENTDFSKNPIAQVASNFLDAVLKGDTDRGKALLTPQAVQQIVANDRKFDPPGVDNPSFRIEAVRMPTDDHAFVQCAFNYTAKGAVHNEEMCCALRLVNNEWRVSGIAYGTTPDKPWILSDFETGKDTPIPRNTSTESNPGQATSGGNLSRPSPPSTAQESAARTDAAPERR